MKLIIKDYLSSLNEQVGLNDLVPRLLRLEGYNVVTEPNQGVRQDGVDILAEKNGLPFLITIKQGDIDRNNWNNGKNALRQSLDEIIDVYIPKNLPMKYKKKKINIIILFNGTIKQSVLNNIDGYICKNKEYNFILWNIDNLTDLVYKNLLNENIVCEKETSLFRKCLSLINETGFNNHFYNELIENMINEFTKNDSPRFIERNIMKIITIQRILCDWDKERNTYLNKINCCEILLLKITNKLLVLNKNKKQFEFLFNSIMKIYIDMLDYYFNNAILLKNTYRSISFYDDFAHKEKLFEILSILSIYGLVLFYKNANDVKKINEIHDLIVNILLNYDGTRYIPLESNCSEISLVLMFMYKTNDYETLKNYSYTLLEYQRRNYKNHNIYPFPIDDYYEAMRNFRDKTIPFESSIVIENLCEWFVLFEEDSKKAQEALLFYKKEFKGISFQTWYYNSLEETEFYEGNKNIGTCFVMPEYKTLDEYKSILKKILKSIDNTNFISEKKNIQYISMIASRLYRMPINPYLYLEKINNI